MRFVRNQHKVPKVSQQPEKDTTLIIKNQEPVVDNSNIGYLRYNQEIRELEFLTKHGWVLYPNHNLKSSENLSDVHNRKIARTNLGLVSNGDGDIWIEKTGDTMHGDLTFHTGTPRIIFTESNGPKDEKNWYLYAKNGELHGRAFNDANSIHNDWLTVSRDGSQIDRIILSSNSNIILNSKNLVVTGSVQSKVKEIKPKDQTVINVGDENFISVKMNSSISFIFEAPIDSHWYEKTWKITIGSTPHEPIFLSSTKTLALWPNNDQPKWKSNSIYYLTSLIENDSTVSMFVKHG